MDSSDLIYMIDNDKNYGNVVKAILAAKKYENVVFFADAQECLKNMAKKPKVLIANSHLHDLSGVQLIKKARAVYPNFFSILLSSDLQNDPFKICDDRFLQYVDKFIIKGMNDLEEIEAVSYNFA